VQLSMSLPLNNWIGVPSLPERGGATIGCVVGDLSCASARSCEQVSVSRTTTDKTPAEARRVMAGDTRAASVCCEMEDGRLRWCCESAACGFANQAGSVR